MTLPTQGHRTRINTGAIHLPPTSKIPRHSLFRSHTHVESRFTRDYARISQGSEEGADETGKVLGLGVFRGACGGVERTFSTDFYVLGYY